MTFRLKIIQVGKFPTSWRLTKLQDFGTHAYLSLHGSTLTLGPSSFDCRNARKIPFSLFFPFLPPFLFSSVLTLSLFSPNRIYPISTELIPLGNFLPFSSSPLTCHLSPYPIFSSFLFFSSLFFLLIGLFFPLFFLVLIPPNLSFVCSHSHFFSFISPFDFIPFITSFDTWLNLSHPWKCHCHLPNHMAIMPCVHLLGFHVASHGHAMCHPTPGVSKNVKF